MHLCFCLFLVDIEKANYNKRVVLSLDQGMSSSVHALVFSSTFMILVQYEESNYGNKVGGLSQEELSCNEECNNIEHIIDEIGVSSKINGCLCLV